MTNGRSSSKVSRFVGSTAGCSVDNWPSTLRSLTVGAGLSSGAFTTSANETRNPAANRPRKTIVMTSVAVEPRDQAACLSEVFSLSVTIRFKKVPRFGKNDWTAQLDLGESSRKTILASVTRYSSRPPASSAPSTSAANSCSNLNRLTSQWTRG